MPIHRYLVADPVTDRPLAWLPLTDTTYSRRISTAGDLTASYTITPQLGEVSRLLYRRPLALYAIRGSVIWWGGLIWGANPAGGRRGEPSSCQVAAATFDSLPDRRRILTELTIETADRGAAIHTIWDHLQTGPGAGIGLDCDPTVIGGELFDGYWDPTAAVPYSEALRDVTALDPPIETMVDVWADVDGTRHRQLRIGDPLIGDQTAAPHLVATPATVQGWGDVADHTTRPSHAVARGAAVAKNIGGDVVPVVSSIHTTGISDVLRVDGVVDVDSEDPSVLESRAGGLLAGPSVVPSVTVRLPDRHTWTPSKLGERGRVTLASPMFEGGVLDTTARIVGVRVTPAQRGRPETVEFEFQTSD